jgi:hypothetical protein
MELTSITKYAKQLAYVFRKAGETAAANLHICTDFITEKDIRGATSWSGVSVVCHPYHATCHPGQTALPAPRYATDKLTTRAERFQSSRTGKRLFS